MSLKQHAVCGARGAVGAARFPRTAAAAPSPRRRCGTPGVDLPGPDRRARGGRRGRRTGCGCAPSAPPRSGSRPSPRPASRATRATSPRSTGPSPSSFTCATRSCTTTVASSTSATPRRSSTGTTRPGPMVLVAFMYRVHEGKEPAYARSVLPWHSHCDGWSVVMHTWFTNDLRSGIARSHRAPSSPPPSTATSATRRLTRRQGCQPKATAAGPRRPRRLAISACGPCSSSPPARPCSASSRSHARSPTPA